MKAVGIVVEYNPFHNGHAYHLQKSLELSKADVAIAVMSGNFLQRGEMALVDKWSRTRMALAAGVDIIIELPVIHAVQKADLFAKAAIQLLAAMKCHHIAFGSENGESESFVAAAHTILNNQAQYNLIVQNELVQGVSYPVATGRAFQVVSGSNKLDLSQPNNCLGYHYVAAIVQLGLTIEPLTFTRAGVSHHATSPIGNFASATSIRQAITNNNYELLQYAPEFVASEIIEYQRNNQSLHRWESYWQLLQYKILSASPTQLQRIYEVKEGLEYRLIECASNSESFATFIEQMKTRRYTYTRLQRICTYVLLNIEAELVAKYPKPNYIRLLGLSETGRQYLKLRKKELTLPIVTKLSDYRHEDYLEQIRFNQTYYQVLPHEQRQVMWQREYEKPILK